MSSSWIVTPLFACLSAAALSLPASAQDDPPPLTREQLLESMRGESNAAEAAVNARMVAATTAYIARIEAARAEVRSYTLPTGSIDHDSMIAALDQLDAWAELVDRNRTYSLDAGQMAEISRLSADISRLQQRILPRLRRSFSAPPTSIGDGVDCIAERRLLDRGMAYQNVVICTSPEFRYQREMIRFHNRIRTLIFRLRFDSTRYRPDELDPLSYYEYPLDVPRDGDVVLWQQSGEFRLLG